LTTIGEIDVYKWDSETKLTVECINYQGEQAFLLSMEDLENPLFHYSCVIQESNYYKLKKEQNIVIEFEGFPKELAAMAKKCSKPKGKTESKFFCNFNICRGESSNCDFDTPEWYDNLPHVDEPSGYRRFIPKYGCLEIYERGTFKNMLHLKLDFYELDDLSVKNKLINDIHQSREETENIQKLAKENDKLVKDKEKELKAKEKELEMYKAACEKAGVKAEETKAPEKPSTTSKTPVKPTMTKTTTPAKPSTSTTSKPATNSMTKPTPTTPAKPSTSLGMSKDTPAKPTTPAKPMAMSKPTTTPAKPTTTPAKPTTTTKVEEKKSLSSVLNKAADKKPGVSFKRRRSSSSDSSSNLFKDAIEHKRKMSPTPHSHAYLPEKPLHHELEREVAVLRGELGHLDKEFGITLALKEHLQSDVKRLEAANIKMERKIDQYEHDFGKIWVLML